MKMVNLVGTSAREYDITPFALERWIKIHKETGSFAAKDNRSEEENELTRLRKKNERLTNLLSM